MHKKQYNDLRRRAEELLSICHNKKPISHLNVSQLIDELTIYQIELESQNEHLLKTQAELEESRGKYIDLYELAPIGYFAINNDGLIKEVNQAGCLLLGLAKNALINRCFARYIVAEHQTIFSQYRRHAFKEEVSQSYELKLLRWSQPSFHALLECRVIKNIQTAYQQLLTFVTDISPRKLAEENLHQLRIKISSIDRLRSLNELVYGISRDQSRSLTMIDNYLHGCVRRIESGNYKIDEILQILKKAATQSRVLSEIILNRKNLTSKSIFRYEHVNLHTMITQMISLLAQEMLEFPVTIQYEASNSHVTVKLDQFHVQQAILNIARNAFEAMRDGNTQEPKLLIEIVLTSNNMVEVTLFDNGPGINEELLPKIFEPHFTTKSYSVGLGLTVSRAIIEKHGGELFVLPHFRRGTCFGFTLPCAPCYPANNNAAPDIENTNIVKGAKLFHI